MEIKPCTEPMELKLLRFLTTRMNLPVNEQQNYVNLEKGYEGELMFNSFTKKLHGGLYILNDLLLKVNNTVFQIDTVIIVQETIYLIEVKNYEGDFYYKSDRFYTLFGKEIKNPLLQLKRSEALLRQFLQSLGFNFPIEAYLIFIHPEFTLYHAPLNEPIIFPTQLNRFMKKLNGMPSNLNEKHKNLADQLVSAHLNQSPFTQMPPYELDQLQKGIMCIQCHSLLTSVCGRELICDVCGFHEEIEPAIIRSVEEFKLLFPNEKITTNRMYEWCKVIRSKKTMRRILKQHYCSKGKKKYSYYE